MRPSTTEACLRVGSTAAKSSAIALLMLASGSCDDGGQSDRDASPNSENVVVGIGEETFPSDSLADWVSYSVKICRLTVVSEEEIPPPEAVYQRREGYIGRRVNLRVDATAWVSDGAVLAGIDARADTVAIIGSGWVLRNGVRHRFALERSPRLEVGGSYIMPLTTLLRPAVPATDAGVVFQAQWSPLSTAAVIASSDSAIAMRDVSERGQSVIAAQLSERTFEEIAAELNRTQPHPAAKMFWHLTPLERWRAVSASPP